jgi:dTDP-4-amino-4,6-dideoxygalactose transaminase
MNNAKIIPFHIPFVSGDEEKFLQEAISRAEFSGDGYFTKACEQSLKQIAPTHKVLLTSSCTGALEMAAILCEIQPGDEVIMPSYNFVSAGNAFVLRGAKLVFVDIEPGTMNMDISLLGAAITSRTKAIVVIHYGGVACPMDELMAIAEENGILVIEDAAHCIGAYYKERHLGTIGHLGAISFHATKNIQCGEGGCLLVNDTSLVERAEIVREKGTNRKAFLMGQVDKYSWIDIGSSYLMSELNAAFLFGQLPHWATVKKQRKDSVAAYRTQLDNIKEHIDLPDIPDAAESNHHLFFIRCKNKATRLGLQLFLKRQGIAAYFHYVPLHSSRAGKQFGRFCGTDKYTTKASTTLLRLPLFPGMSDVTYITTSIKAYYDDI